MEEIPPPGTSELTPEHFARYGMRESKKTLDLDLVFVVLSIPIENKTTRR